MTSTPNLELPEFGSAGIPSGVELTRGMRRLDAIVQLSVISMLLTAPPSDPILGDRYIVASGGTGEWADRDLHVAAWTQLGWAFLAPRAGWIAWDDDSQRLMLFDASVPEWIPLPSVVSDLLLSATFLTVADETATLPSSLRLAEGANIDFAVSSSGELVISSTAGGGSSENVTADTHPVSANAADDEFETGSAIDTAGTRFSGATSWTAFSLSTGTDLVEQGALTFRPALTASRNVGGYSQPVTGTWGYTCKIQIKSWSTNTLLGMFVATASGASGNIVVLGFNGTTLIVQRLTNSTTFSSNVSTAASVLSATGATAGLSHYAYLRITYDGTTLRFYLSWTGIEESYHLTYSETSAAFLGTPALAGICGDNESASLQSKAIYDWFRKTS